VEEGELMDVYEFLAQEKSRLKKPENGELSPRDSPETSPRAADKLKYFQLSEGEELLAEYACILERKILYQGILLVTANHLCFYSHFPSKKNKSQIHIKDIQCIEKTKSLIVASAIKITTKDGKKHLFNWKQNNVSRDQAFTKLLELLDQQQQQDPCVHDEKQEIVTEAESSEKKGDNESDDSSSPDEEPPKQQDKTWSRFDD